MLLAQTERTFHRDERYPQTHHLSTAPSEEARIRLTDLANPTNPLGQVQGYEQGRKRLCDAACTALARYNHVCNDVAFLLTGPKGAHKAEIARRFAELLRLPFIDISPTTIKTAHNLFIGISNGLQRAGLPLVECKGPGRYVLPPCVVFLDDCEGLKQKPTVWPAFLQAVAITDPTLRTEQGVLVKTIQATWLLATTRRADLMDGLPDRFTELAMTSPGAAPSLEPSDLDQKYRPAPRPDLSGLRAKRAELEKRGILGPPTQPWLKESGDVNPPMPPAENLKRWKESPQPRAWVEAHKGEWNHADWLSLVEELKKSGYWPMDPDSVGQVLEELKQAYHTQRRPTDVPASPSGSQQGSPRTVPKQSPAASADQESQPTGAKVCDFCHVNTLVEKRADFVNLEYIWTASCPQCGNQWEYAAGTWVHKGLRKIPSAEKKPKSPPAPVGAVAAHLPPRPVTASPSAGDIELKCYNCGAVNKATVKDSEWRCCHSCGKQIYFKIGVGVNPPQHEQQQPVQQPVVKNIHCLNAEWSCLCGVTNRVMDGYWPENSLITCSSCQRQFGFPAEWLQTGRSYTTPPPPQSSPPQQANPPEPNTGPSLLGKIARIGLGIATAPITLPLALLGAATDDTTFVDAIDKVDDLLFKKKQSKETKASYYAANCPRCRQWVRCAPCPNCHADALHFGDSFSGGRFYSDQFLSCAQCHVVYKFLPCSCGCQIATDLFRRFEG